jgi:putative two-component system response regulator
MIGSVPARVLIVDDSELQVEALQRLLQHDGYECASVSRGDEAFAAAAEMGPDVILLDIGLPGIDGMAICRQLKSDVRTRLTPVLMMTGEEGEDRHVGALEAGADDFLKKPITMAKLRPRVRSAIRLKQYVDELDNAAASLIMLAAAIEARDPHTLGHCERLADYGKRLARRVGLASGDLRAIDRGGFLHDLGKIAVPDAILFKPGPLTSDEFAIVKTHPSVGERICMPLRTLAQVRPIIRQHHELLDGTGYPDGLHGSAIALTSQIIGFADVYDALTSDRPYRSALAPATALEMLEDACRAGQRDRTLFELFVDDVTKGFNPADAGMLSCAPGCPRCGTNLANQAPRQSCSRTCRWLSTTTSCCAT